MFISTCLLGRFPIAIANSNSEWWF